MNRVDTRSTELHQLAEWFAAAREAGTLPSLPFVLHPTRGISPGAG